jgi:Fe2+ or Zn2+ uptake regulation protein
LDTEDVTMRRLEVQKIALQLKQKGKPVNRYSVYPLLKKKGFVTSYTTVYRDINAISRENTWVRDLAESNYSAYQEEISNRLQWIEDQAEKQYKKKWKTAKKSIKNQKTKEGALETTEQSITTENAQPKIGFLKIIKEVQELKMKHTNGENINISAALLGKKFNKIKTQYKTDKEEETKPEEIVDVLKLAAN